MVVCPPTVAAPLPAPAFAEQSVSAEALTPLQLPSSYSQTSLADLAWSTKPLPTFCPSCGIELVNESLEEHRA